MRLLSKRTSSKKFPAALFLDRDGIINEDYGYVFRKENFDFKPGIFGLVSKANKAGYLCIIITNQSGIGRGLYTIEEFRDLSIWMCKQFDAHGAEVNAIYFSPFHPTEGQGKYLLDENTRKPAPGMFLEAAQDFNINLSNSIMVGDKISDMRAGLAAGVGRNYLVNNEFYPEHSKMSFEKITVVSNLEMLTSNLIW